MNILNIAAILAAGLGLSVAATLGAESAPLLVPILGNDYAPYASVEAGAAFVKLHEWVFKEPGSDTRISAIDYDMGFQCGFRIGLGFEPYNKLKKSVWG